MPVTTMFHSDSTDKVIDRRIFSGNADYTDHLERCYYALQARYDALLRRDTDNLKRLIATHARYDALKAAGEDMEAAIRSLDHTVAHPLYASECPVCIALDTYCDIAFRAATGKGRV